MSADLGHFARPCFLGHRGGTGTALIRPRNPHRLDGANPSCVSATSTMWPSGFDAIGGVDHVFFDGPPDPSLVLNRSSEAPAAISTDPPSLRLNGLHVHKSTRMSPAYVAACSAAIGAFRRHCRCCQRAVASDCRNMGALSTPGSRQRV